MTRQTLPKSRTRSDEHIALQVAECPEFAGLDIETIEKLVELGTVIELPSGATLYSAGEPSDRIYVVSQGRLRVTANNVLVGYIGRLQTVGEMGVLTEEPRSSTVRAVRDSVILSIDADIYRDFMDKHPTGYRALMKVALTRVRQGPRAKSTAAGVKGTFAVIPSTADVPVRVLAETMVSRLSGWPSARLITAQHVDAALGEGTARAPLDDGEASARIADWLADLERTHQYLVFAADSGRDPWAARCLHNADRVLVLAEALATPAAVPVLEELRSHGMVAPVELVLLRPEGDSSPHTMAWRAITGARAHYFVHPWERAELDSLARQVTNRGITLVLGGGGARGFAHIGLVRALEDMGIRVDVTGGTSMGAFMAALVACGYNSMDMTEIARETFVRVNYLNDWAVPRASLIRGQRFAGRLHDIFGDRTIEDLRRTFFCVGTNITTGQAKIADRGELYRWLAVSMAIPGVAPPVAFDGELLCDGGVVDNLPIDVMRGLERGAVIACNVSTDGALLAPGAGVGEPDLQAMLNWKGATKAPSLPEILVRTAMLSSAVAVEASARNADVYVKMPVQDFRIFDWKGLDALVELGYEHGRAQLELLRDRLV